jgi:glycine C-acetyltransferase
MMDERTSERLDGELEAIRAAGLRKDERIIAGPQGARVRLRDGRETLNLCANNYLGLSNHPAIVRAAIDGLERHGYGLSSVRFICGTQDIHKRLEDRVSAFLGVEDTILYSSCFDANGGLFETLLGAEDAVVSDALNHASIIDGIRLSKARRLRYANGDMADLEARLREADAAGARTKLIATDGVFSMDGHVAKLAAICELAERHGALVMVDDSHAVGFMGPGGRGTPAHCGVEGRVDILTGTFGKALGGAGGGYVSGRRRIVDLLRQRSRPYLFSNSLSPAVVCASLKALEIVSESAALCDRLWENTRHFRERMAAAGFDVVPGEHPIVPVMFGDALLAARVSEALLARGVYAVAFSYPVVPKGQARIRTQISAAHTQADLDFAVEAFREAFAEVSSADE